MAGFQDHSILAVCLTRLTLSHVFKKLLTNLLSAFKIILFIKQSARLIIWWKKYVLNKKLRNCLVFMPTLYVFLYVHEQDMIISLFVVYLRSKYFLNHQTMCKCLCIIYTFILYLCFIILIKSQTVLASADFVLGSSKIPHILVRFQSGTLHGFI